MISGNAPCRLRWMESTFDRICFFEPPSVFHRSIRNFAKSSCVLFALASSCVSIPFNCVTEAYETGCPPCAEDCPLAADGVGAGPAWPSAPVMNNKKEVRIDNRMVRFIVGSGCVRDQQAYYNDR